MLLTLESVKIRLGLAVDDTSQDQALTEDIQNAAIWIESQTHQRFDTPKIRNEYRRGSGMFSMFLAGHIDVESPSFDDILIQEHWQPGDEWVTLDAVTTYERRGNELVRIDGTLWNYYYEYHLQYLDGYRDGFAPRDIQALALELVLGQYIADTALTSDSAGLTSETLVGVYSYNVTDSSGGSSGQLGGGTLSDIAQRTLNSYTRRLV